MEDNLQAVDTPLKWKWEKVIPFITIIEKNLENTYSNIQTGLQQVHIQYLQAMLHVLVTWKDSLFFSPFFWSETYEQCKKVTVLQTIFIYITYQ